MGLIWPPVYCGIVHAYPGIYSHDRIMCVCVLSICGATTPGRHDHFGPVIYVFGFARMGRPRCKPHTYIYRPFAHAAEDVSIFVVLGSSWADAKICTASRETQTYKHTHSHTTKNKPGGGSGRPTLVCELSECGARYRRQCLVNVWIPLNCTTARGMCTSCADIAVNNSQITFIPYL